MNANYGTQRAESGTRIARLKSGDVALARRVFALMAQVFDEALAGRLGDEYLHSLLARPDFFALAALRGGEPVGGITAHVLPMTRDESSELFIYDLAVHPACQRQGIGRALVTELRDLAAVQGVRVAFVPADVDDDHALDFYRALGGAEAPVSIFTFESTSVGHK